MIAVLVTLAATTLIQLGYFLWKVSADGQPKIGRDPIRKVALALATDWRFILGFAATSLGWVLFVQAMALGDISVVQPLMSAGELLLVILAVVFLKERLGGIEWVGVLLTVLGAAALAWGVENSLTTAFDTPRLLILLGAMVLSGGVLFLANRQFKRPEIFLSLVVGLCFGAGALLTKAMTIKFTALGQAVISWATLIDPLLPAIILANVFGLILLQATFQRGRAAIIVPVQLAATNAVTVLAGVVIFAEHITPLRAAGIVLIIMSTVLLQSGGKR